MNVDNFDTRNLDKAGYAQNPLRDDSLAAYRVYEIPMTSITVEATQPLGVKPRDAERSKNFFALGLICWMYTRPSEPLFDWMDHYGAFWAERFANLRTLLKETEHD